MVRPAESTLGAQLARDEPVYGVNVLSASPAIIEALADTELDYVWVDLEILGQVRTTLIGLQH